jgi:hypothetical protein
VAKLLERKREKDEMKIDFGKVYEIVDVGKDDAFFDVRNKMIGAKVILSPDSTIMPLDDIFGTIVVKGGNIFAAEDIVLATDTMGDFHFGRGSRIWIVEFVVREYKEKRNGVHGMADKRQKRATVRKHQKST